jgi:hypothetical protein
MVPIDAQSKKATHTVATFLKKAFMFLLLTLLQGYRLNIVPILSFALFIVERRSLLNNIAPIFIPKRVDIFTFFLHSFLKISKYYIFGSRFFTFIA